MTAEPSTKPSDWTIGRLLSWTTEYFTRRGVDEARLASEVLLAYSGSCRRIDLYSRFEEVLEAEQVGRFRELVKRAGEHEPIAYLVGQKEFFSLALVVTPDVLIPRPETETLVECVIDHCKQAGLESPFVVDVGTGSGCLAIALLSQLPGARVVATDCSPAALEVARRNAAGHEVDARLTLVQADFLALPQGVGPEGGFDILACNPPYISLSQMDSLPETVRCYEPRSALTDEADGLSFYRRLATEGVSVLGNGGAAFFEIGDGQAEAVVGIVTGAGLFVCGGVFKDRVLGRDRVVKFIPS